MKIWVNILGEGDENLGEFAYPLLTDSEGKIIFPDLSEIELKCNQLVNPKSTT